MAVAYHAPLCLSCAALMATDSFPLASPPRNPNHHPTSLFLCCRGVDGCGVRTPGGRSSITTGKRRTMRDRRSASWGRISCAFYDAPEFITPSSWQESVVQSNVLVLVEFWASWCGPCRMAHRVIEEVAQDYSGRIRCFKLNTDDYPHIAASHGIERVPTVLLFKNGVKLQSFTGTLPKSVYVTAIEKSLAH